jgi:hypothetical protein
MTWPQLALLLSRHIGEVPNVLAKGNAFLQAPPWQQKNEALRGLSEAFDPLFIDIDSHVGTLDLLTEHEAEATLQAALDDGQPYAMGFLDRLKQIKELYQKLAPWLNLVGVPAPPLPFNATTG